MIMQRIYHSIMSMLLHIFIFVLIINLKMDSASDYIMFGYYNSVLICYLLVDFNKYYILNYHGVNKILVVISLFMINLISIIILHSSYILLIFLIIFYISSIFNEYIHRNRFSISNEIMEVIARKEYTYSLILTSLILLVKFNIYLAAMLIIITIFKLYVFLKISSVKRKVYIFLSFIIILLSYLSTKVISFVFFLNFISL